jgi:Undecaprenyl-phosphate galactose phosphotransferase WbaP
LRKEIIDVRGLDKIGGGMEKMNSDIGVTCDDRLFEGWVSTAKTVSRVKTTAELLIISLVDICSVLAIFHLSVMVRISVLPLFYTGFPSELQHKGFAHIWWIFIVWFFFFYYEGLYSKRLSYWDETRALCSVSFFSTVGIFTIVSIGKLSEEISRTVIILMGFWALLLLPLVRAIAKKVLRSIGLLKRRVLILGAGETGRLILKALRREPNYGYEVIGFVDDDTEKCGKRIEGVKVHRGVDKAGNYLKRCDITDIFIAMPGAGKERLQGLINQLQHKAERILFVPDMFGIAVLGTGLRHFFHEEVLAFEIENNLSNAFNIIIKRCFDIVMSLLMLPFLLICMGVLALLIRLDSRGPAIFSQERIGEKGRIFRCFKFRTMYVDAEERLTELFAQDPGTKREWEKRWKLKDDPRVTKIGRLLRSTSLDELPQILNVLKGEMSLVGPRPYLPRERKVMGEHDHTILLTKPGITGLWQVSGRSSMSYEYRINLDSWYVKNWNLWLDIVILFKTVRVVIKREGAY